jgi:hypothetical protein
MELKSNKPENQETSKKLNILSYPIIAILLVIGIVSFGFIIGPVFDVLTGAVSPGWGLSFGYDVLFVTLLLILVLFLLVRALIYVYKDSKRRNMSPMLWILICIFFPYFLGFLVYLLVRDPIPLTCPGCRAVVAKEDIFCKQCGNKLADTCKKCGGHLPGGAKFCPNCGTQSDA